ncbi:LMBR1 domain-containing protein 2-B [Aphelenchoides avenae]|nr:LMBR1 domain-containing protein 2-B [Aphelenchus avenae]
MGVVFLAFELLAILALTATVLSKYCNWRKHHPVVTLATLVGWYFSFLIILVLPLDVAITFYRMCQREGAHVNVTDGFSDSVMTNGTLLECEEPRGYVPEQVLLSLWRVVYWTSQLLTWLLLPIMQIYSRAGEFTATGKLKYALYNNMIYYASYGIIFIFLLFYAVSKGVSLNFDHLKVLIVSASNTWGLFILVVLLGYGLVEVPRHFWQMGRRGYRLNQTYFEIDKLSSDKNEAEDGIAEVYREAREVMNVLKSTRGDAREKAHQIMARFPQEVIQELNSSKSVNFQSASTFGTVDVGAASNDNYLVGGTVILLTNLVLADSV